MHLLSTNRLTSLLYSPWLCYPWALPLANSPLHPPLSSVHLCMCHLFCSLIFFPLVFFLFLGFFLLHTWVESIGVSLLLICLQTCKEQSWYMTWIGQENLNKVTRPGSSNKLAKKGKFHHGPSATSEAASPPLDGVQRPPFWVSTDRLEVPSQTSGCLFLFGVQCIPQRNKT